MSAAGAGGERPNIEDVFSTYLYEGTGSAQTITNGIDLSGEGGLVWVKDRDTSSDHRLFDTATGAGNSLISNGTYQLQSSSGTSFTSTGFGIGSGADFNNNNNDFVSWTFRKAPKFFDVVTYTGNSTARTISHNLGTAPGFMVVKRTSGSGTNWMCFHRSVGATKGAILNGSNTFSTDSTTWNNTAPTDSVFSLGTDANVNGSGHDYVAYLWAHNNSDGEFGPNSDQDIIKCGSYTGNNSTDGPTIDLGFEPQWVMVKHTTNGFIDWFIFDNMRAFTAKGINANKYLIPNSSGAEDGSQDYITPRPDGFQVHGTGSHTNANAEYVYIAIRRGPLAEPTSSSQVFEVDNAGSTGDGVDPKFRSGFPVDFALRKDTGSGNWEALTRLLQGTSLRPNDTNAEDSGSGGDQFDYMNGYNTGTNTDSSLYSWMWKRAPGYFDVVTWDGNNTSGRSITHNLGVAPEMIWCKNRGYSGGEDWVVYHKGMNGGTDPEDYVMYLNQSSSESNVDRWYDFAPTDTIFKVSNDRSMNGNVADGNRYIAYLFATLAGVSKVGSYTGNGGSGTTGNTQNIDCGFSNGAKFVLIKPRNASDSWLIFDADRGISSGGSDPYLTLNDQANEIGGDNINPYSAGFTVVQHGNGSTNLTGREYIFYAVAN